MPKINQEEYEVLKNLDDNKWKWIARNYNGALITYTDKPMKNPNLYWDSFGERMDDRLFQSIQWEDEEPYNIAELIREYEWAQLNEKYPPVRESEETEVKSKQELIEKWESAIEAAEFYGKGKEDRLIEYMRNFVDDLNRLDEPEVLSQEWIAEHTYYEEEYGFYFADPDELENLLVPKQEEVDRAYKDGYEKGRELGFYKGYREGLGNKGGEPETVADVVTTFWKSYERLKEVMSMEVKELEE